jgi:EAL domain-containing protein (putative c-di-GMP-specific phosphodiesterase class I)
VEWTTPIILGGLHGTGSAAGALLQVINVLLGVLIYLPFVRLLDRQSDARDREHYAAFMKYFKENEQELVGVRMTELSDIYGDFAKGLCAEMRHGMAKQIRLAYQPQYSHDGHCIGVEALLRWQHPTHGMLYPPLVIKLAEEAGLLPDLEETIFLRALSDRPAILKEYGEEAKISINITGTTIVTPRFLAFCRAQNEADPFKGRNICIEITEQATLSLGEETRAALLELRQMGLLLAIDDFSMGQTSLHYLKDNMFDIIKLDGSLVQGLFVHQNCREIISSIAQLAASLDLSVIAEYVETAEQRSVLHEIGCDIYQGYLYSPAVFLSENK